VNQTAQTLVLPRPLDHQRRVLDAPHRFKLWRAGRRTGKSRAELLAGIAGHGPERVRKGVLQGGAVAWFAPDYKQAQAIWREEIRPRFAGRPFADVSEVEKRVAVHGAGWLQLLSAENIDAARGWKLDGVLCDEGAYWDLEYGWNAVIRPALADKQGWAMFGSTTNAGHDGNSAKRVPSYFNQLCERAERGEMGPDWGAFHNRTEDNPTIRRAEIAALRAEYPAGSPIAAQELDAELGVMGGRYYEVRDVHLVPRADLPDPLPPWWEVWGAFDWGYAHWAVFGLFAKCGEAVFLLDTYWARRQQDADLAKGVRDTIADWGRDARSLTIYAGHDCWAKTTARGATGVTTAEVFMEHGLWLAEAHIDKANGGKVVRRMLADADAQRQSGFYIVDRPEKPGEVAALGTTGNRRVLRQLTDAIPDPNDVNKPAKVDADPDGRGGDDGADMTRYGLATRVWGGHEPAPAAPHPLLVQYDTTDLGEYTGAERDRLWDDLPHGY
jgi:hypothetical protein